MLYETIVASLTEAAFNTVYVKHFDLFHIAKKNSDGDVDYEPCGALLLKVVLDEATSTTNSTVSKLQVTLSTGLNKLFNQDCKKRISSFSTAVQSTKRRLEGYGVTTADDTLLPNVMRTLAAELPKGTELRNYLDLLRMQHDSGSETYTVATFLTAMENKEIDIGYEYEL